MNTFVNAIKNVENQTVTANGDPALKSTLNALLDFYYQGGAARSVEETTILGWFKAAIAQDEDYAIRALFYIRDIREGLGERRTARICLSWLSQAEPEISVRILPKVVEFGRWDDVLSMIDGDKTVSIAVFNSIFDALNSGNAGLVAKWMPRKGLIAARIRGFKGMNEASWRKLLVSRTDVVESKMCAKEWENIDYSSVPSVASSRYAKAFRRHDEAGYASYLESVMTGKINEKTGKIEKFNADVLYPYNVYGMDASSAQAAWDNLRDFVGDHSFLPIIDTSGSMGCAATGSVSCMQVAISLGTYLAERNKSAFKNLAMTFSSKPTWIKIPEHKNIKEKFSHVQHSGNWDMSTDLDKAFELILSTAKNGNVNPSDMPQFLIVLSDMQFDAGYGSKRASQRVVEKFRSAGYEAPVIIWWNLNSSYGNVPVAADESGMILVSGFSPSVMSNVLSGEVTPEKIMLKTLSNPRYDWK